MKPATRLPLLAAFAFAAPASAEVIYSNLQNLAIPKTNDGLYLNVLTGATANTGWHINPTFGGINVYNNSTFQPLREASVGNAMLSNIPTGGLISSASTGFATGMGVSSDHLGTGGTFTAGSEGYIGFSVVNGAATHYGWMRVVFTGTGTPLVKDWAYDTSGGGIAAGNVIQSGSTFTLDSSTRSFALGSAITGANAVIKTGANTATLNTANTYTGTTTINQGTLRLSTVGSTHADSAVTVNATAALGGDGTVNGAATFNDSSIFAWNLSVYTPAATASATVADTLTVGTLTDGGTTGGSVFKILLAGGQTFADTFWTANHEWTNVLTSGSGVSDLSTLFTSFSYENANGTIAAPTGGWAFTLSGSTLSYVPEPSSALAGLLLTAGLLRRRRTA